jgi:6-pyruvoyltetrahydropterin/6-carboxytetrahydropterin synthase
MPTVYVTRRLHFSAAHRLHSDHLDADKNKKVYGLCNNPNAHGHNYELKVTIKGEPDPVTGMVIDLKELKDIVNQHVIARLDHMNLNVDVDFLQGTVPTAENIVVAIWNQLEEKFPNGELYELALYETPRNSAVYRGEN